MDKIMADVRRRFPEEVNNHKLTILQDDGVHRCLLFKNPSSSNYYFYINTWPGHLCISGDMGCVVFCRLEDMFEFFRGDNGKINPGYWAEKIVSNSEFGHGTRAWCEDLAKEMIMSIFNEWKENAITNASGDIEYHEDCIKEIEEGLSEDGAEAESLRADLEENKEKLAELIANRDKLIQDELDYLTENMLNCCESEVALVRAYENYECNDGGVEFSDPYDFYERLPNCKTYTYHYIWQCHAIVWAIAEYDKFREGKIKYETA